MTDDKKYTTTVKLKTGAPAYETVSPVPPEDGPSADLSTGLSEGDATGVDLRTGPFGLHRRRRSERRRFSDEVFGLGPHSGTLQRIKMRD
jgi:hypothetical protein